VRGRLRAGPPLAVTCREEWLVETRLIYLVRSSSSHSTRGAGQLLVEFCQMAPSRQERRKAERAAAKRAPAQAGAAGAAGAAAAAANVVVNVNPLGDWTTQTENPALLFGVIGGANVRRRAGEGDPEAQYSAGFRLMREALGGASGPLGADGRSPMADVGLAL